jgi:hypothetical protein
MFLDRSSQLGHVRLTLAQFDFKPKLGKEYG